jgi:ASCH domain
MQPWAEMIVRGYKPVENRTWRTKFRGDLLIHAGQRIDAAGVRWINERFPEIILPTFAVGINMGGIVGSATVVDCVDEHESPWFFGPVGFLLANPHRLPFLRVPGKLGLFRCDYIPFC